MRPMTYGEARQIARDLAKDTLKNYWQPGSYPVDPVAIARRAGIEVYSAQLGTLPFVQTQVEAVRMHVPYHRHDGQQRDDSRLRMNAFECHHASHFNPNSPGSNTMFEPRASEFTPVRAHSHESANPDTP